MELVRIDVESVLENAGEQDESLVEELLADGEIADTERGKPIADIVELRYEIEKEREKGAYGSGCAGRRAESR